MKVLQFVFIVAALSSSAFAVEEGKFDGCKKDGDCIQAPCEKREILDKVESSPVVECVRVLKLNPQTKKHEHYFYEIGVKLGPILGCSKGDAECAEKKTPGVLFRVN